MELSIDIIRSYNFEERTYKPDWDDVCVDFTLSNGITLTTMTVCNNEPTESDSLEGLDGFIYIETKEELDELNAMTYDEALEKVASENEDFDIEEWI